MNLRASVHCSSELHRVWMEQEPPLPPVSSVCLCPQPSCRWAQRDSSGTEIWVKSVQADGQELDHGTIQVILSINSWQGTVVHFGFAWKPNIKKAVPRASLSLWSAGTGHTPTQVRSLEQRLSEGDSSLHCFLGTPHSWGGEGGRRKEILCFSVMEAAHAYSLK